MRLSLEWKLYWINIVCQSLFFIYSSITLFITVNTTLPYIHEGDPNALFNRKVFSWVIFLIVVGNYLSLKFKSKQSLFSHHSKICEKSNVSRSNQTHGNHDDSTSLGGDQFQSKHLHLNSPDSPEARNGFRNNNNTQNCVAGWVECKHCNKLVPPRAKHCSLCRACILKRDHHCFFSGCCIGFHNQRFFIFFCFYGSIAAIYSAFTTSTYLRAHYTGLQEWGIVAYFIPVLIWFWMNASVSGTVVWFVLFLYWSMFTSFICIYFFLLQMFLVFRGQTKCELKKGKFPYCSSLLNNFMSVFGPLRFCFISFLVPFPCIEYWGDGKTWDELSHSSKIA